MSLKEELEEEQKPVKEIHTLSKKLMDCVEDLRWYVEADENVIVNTLFHNFQTVHIFNLSSLCRIYFS